MDLLLRRDPGVRERMGVEMSFSQSSEQLLHGRSVGRRWRTGRVQRLAGASIAFVVVLVTGMIAAPLAGAGMVGSPQPELGQFKLHYGGTTSLSGGTVLADGNTVIVSENSPSDTALKVCTLRPGDRSCFYKHSLPGPGGDGLSGVAVVSTDGANLTVLSYLEGTYGGYSFPILAWNSSNDGATWSASAVVVSSGFDGLDSATVVDGKVVISVEDPHNGLDVQTIDPTGVSVATSYANISSADDSTDLVTNDNGYLLVAAENLNASGGTETDVFQALGSSNLDDSGVYTGIESFPKRELDGLSGNGILLDVKGSLTTIGKISFLNGPNFGTQYKVPDSVAGDDGYATLQQTGDQSGRSDTGVYNVFFEGRRNSYDLIEESTTNGSTWTPQIMYGTAVTSTEPTPVLASSGAGFVFEAGSSDQIMQPVLFPVSVTIALAKKTIYSWQTTTINGTMSIGVQGTGVTLQKQAADGSWNNKATTTELTAGAFSFTVGNAGKYRAVVDTVPGWLQYGYSNAVTLKVTP
jgi:hypothetical protein